MAAAARQAPHATHHHMPAAISLNVFSLRRDLAAVEGVNAKVALLLTRVVGTMWAFWAFNGIALISLPSAVHQHSLTVLINWVSSNWIQLVCLPALMVGQNLQAVASDARAQKTFADTELIVDRLDTRTEGGLADVLAAVHAAITLTGHVSDDVGMLLAAAGRGAGVLLADGPPAAGAVPDPALEDTPANREDHPA